MSPLLFGSAVRLSGAADEADVERRSDWKGDAVTMGEQVEGEAEGFNGQRIGI